MMQLCSTGHIYDDSKHKKCPYCGCDAQSNHDIVTEDQPNDCDTDNEPLFTMGIIPLKRIYPDTEHPVLGWLIHLSEGQEKGRSIEIISECISVGTHFDDDIRLSGKLLPESRVSFLITYDKENKKFFITPKGQFTAMIYINGAKQENTTELCDLDIIQAGDMKLMFKSLCGDKFTWDDQDDETL